MPDDLEEALDRLYGLPADEFTGARDALAKELRGAKRRDEADAIKARRRPTVPAAAINQLARREPELMEALIDAASELREIQDRLLEGDAGRDELRAAADAERRAVAALVTAASKLDDKPSEATLEKVRETLHAAAIDDDVRDAIASGRVEREAEPAGAWGAFPLSGAPLEAPAPARTKRKAAAKTREPEPERELVEVPTGAERAAERRARKRAEALERARTEDAAAQQELEEAEREAKAAHEVLEAAAARAEEARAAVVDAESAEDEARSEAQRTLRALKRAEAVAADTAEKVERLDAAG
jgi:hypothetical protein